eukprot:651238-Pyramimonas_sp.AAC.1
MYGCRLKEKEAMGKVSSTAELNDTYVVSMSFCEFFHRAGNPARSARQARVTPPTSPPLMD